MSTLQQKNDPSETGTTLLTPDEHAACQGIADRQAPHSQRAAALLALDENNTQAQAAEKTGLSTGQVKYWLAKFRKQRMSIFPDWLLESLKPPVESELAAEIELAAGSVSGTADSTTKESLEPIGRKWPNAKEKTRKAKMKSKKKKVGAKKKKSKGKAKKSKKGKSSAKVKKSKKKAGAAKKKKQGKKGKKSKKK